MTVKKELGRLGKNSAVYGIGTMLSRFIGLLLLPLFTAYLTPADYGAVALLALVSMVLVPVFSLGLSAGLGPVYFESQNGQPRATVIWTGSTVLLISASLMLVPSLIFSAFISRLLFGDSSFALLVRFAVTGVAFQVLVTPFRLRMQFEERALAFSLVTIVCLVFTIALKVYLVVVAGLGVKGVLLSQLGGSLLTLVVFASVSMRRTSPQVSFRVAREVLRLGVPMVPSFAFLYIIAQSNRFILQASEGVEAVGIYSVGFSLGMVMGVLVTALRTAWYPFFMSFVNRRDEAPRLFGLIFKYYVFGFGLISAVFFFFAKPVVLLMTQPAFHGAYVVVGFSALAQFFGGMFNMFLVGVYFEKEVRFIPLVQSGAALLSLSLNLVLIRTMGVLGAGIGLAAGHLALAGFMFLWNVYRRRRYMRIHYDWKRIGLFASACFVLCSIAFIERDYGLWIELLVGTGLSGLMTMVVMWLTTQQERALVRQQFTRLRSKLSSRPVKGTS